MLNRFYSFTLTIIISNQTIAADQVEKNFTIFGVSVPELLSSVATQDPPSAMYEARIPAPPSGFNFVKISVNPEGIFLDPLTVTDPDKIAGMFKTAYKVVPWSSGSDAEKLPLWSVGINKHLDDDEYFYHGFSTATIHPKMGDPHIRNMFIRPGEYQIGEGSVLLAPEGIALSGGAFRFPPYNNLFAYFATAGSTILEISNPQSIIESVVIDAQNPSTAFSSHEYVDPYQQSKLAGTGKVAPFEPQLLPIFGARGSLSGIPSGCNSLSLFGVGSITLRCRLQTIKKLLEPSQIA